MTLSKLMTLEQVRRALRLAVAAQGGVRPFARFHKVSPAAVSDALHARPPGPMILATLGLTKVVRVCYRKVEDE
jgi:hypothetical protein